MNTDLLETKTAKPSFPYRLRRESVAGQLRDIFDDYGPSFSSQGSEILYGSSLRSQVRDRCLRALHDAHFVHIVPVPGLDRLDHWDVEMIEETLDIFSCCPIETLRIKLLTSHGLDLLVTAQKAF